MKINISILGLLLAALAFTSCEDNREKNYIPGKVYLMKTGYQSVAPYLINEVETLTAWTIKSGLMPNEACDIEYVFETRMIDDYNAANGTSYEMLPSDCYKMGETVFHISPTGDDARFVFEYYPYKILEYCGGEFNLEKYAFPIRIKAYGMEATDTTALFCFKVREPLIRVFSAPPLTKITQGQSSGDDSDILDFSIEIGLDYVTEKDLEFTIETDGSALQTIASSYEKELDVKLIPESAYTMEGECVINKGQRSVSLAYSIDKTKLRLGMNVLPVKLTGIEAPLKVDEDNDVAFIAIQVMTDRTTQRYWISSTHADARYSKGLTAIFDNSWDTWWRALPADADPTFIVDMGSVQAITAVEIYTPITGTEHPGDASAGETIAPVLTDINIYVSDSDDCWQNTASANWGSSLLYYNWSAQNLENRPHTFLLPDGTTGRYVKVAMKKANNRITIYEAYVYGER